MAADRARNGCEAEQREREVQMQLATERQEKVRRAQGPMVVQAAGLRAVDGDDVVRTASRFILFFVWLELEERLREEREAREQIAKA